LKPTAVPSAAGPDHRAIEVERDALKPQHDQPLQDHLAQQCGEPLHALGIGPGQRSAERRYIRQPVQPEHPFHQRVIGIVADITQLPVTEQQMHHQQQHALGVAEDGAYA
jgi:hypothetical protein